MKCEITVQCTTTSRVKSEIKYDLYFNIKYLAPLPTMV